VGGVNLVILGPPGAGKGTMAGMIHNRYGLAVLSTGDMLRDAVKKGTELGKKASGYMDKGELVPDDVVVGIVRESLEGTADGGFVLDGFPRTRAQAESLDTMLENEDTRLDAVINLEVPREVLIQRLSRRRQCSECGKIYHLDNMPPAREGVCDSCGGKLYQRNDDKPRTIEVRLKEYRDNTLELVDYYRKKGLLKSVDASGNADATFALLEEIISSVGHE